MGDFTIFRKISVFLKNSVTLRIRIGNNNEKRRRTSTSSL